ncbi:copper chaperone PCu(A)C [Actinomarinicola tropica]|uniref:copper chaperone PCu(A)C n=1 Tax=Actinomarinicola tropica TaxID=2789776 RepID=UPI0018994194|nr:copper chaperone PCu(A)C [Actinomarinicola tropica]
MKRRIRVDRFGSLLALLAVVLLAVSCADEAQAGVLSISAARVDRPANPDVAAVRLTIENGTGTSDALVAVSSPDAARASVHRSGVDDAGRATMEPVERLELPAGEAVEFAPGGLHVMLEEPVSDLQVGDEISLTFTFENAGERTIARACGRTGHERRRDGGTPWLSSPGPGDGSSV